MKKFIFALTFILAPCSVHSQQVLPNLYAKRFCEYREMGISADDARTAAMDDAWISTGKPVIVNYKGKMVSSDVIKSVSAVIKLCPQFLQ
jgi:hypothetical protein